MSGSESFPQRQRSDHLRALAEAGVASVPWVGGAGVQLMNVYLPSALERRRDQFFVLLDERLADVEEQILDDEVFQTIVLQATKAALGTHLEEKMRLLAAAVRSSADIVGRGGDTFMAMRFLQWVDELEPFHFEILGAIRDDQGRWTNAVQWGAVFDRVSIEDDDALGAVVAHGLAFARTLPAK